MTRMQKVLARLVDPVIVLALFAAYLTWLLSTVGDLGYARDEGFYFRAAGEYRSWFDILFEDPERALEQKVIDRYWKTNREHPAFVKTLFALSNKYLYHEWHLFSGPGTSYRFPGMVLSSVAVGTVYLWGAEAVGRLAGLVAALLLALMPRVFYHSHLDCFDMPVLTMWLVTTYAYWRSLERGGILWPLITGVLYGFLLNTKHNAWLLPPALILHFLLVRGWRGLRRDLVVGRTSAPLALFFMATVGPAVFYATWPWLWNDTAKRFSDYVAFHTGHDYYNMEFLGVTYFEPPMPRLYAWVMTAATVPTVTLVLFAIGLALSLRTVYWPRIHAVIEALRRRAAKAAPSASRRALSTHTLWGLCLLTSYAPWLSSQTPIFGGTKHWMTAYPFMCLFAAVGFAEATRRIGDLVPARARRFRVAELLLATSVIVGPLVMTLHSHPWGLSTYMPLVGGAPGAATLGLNRSFWGYTTGAVKDFINEAAPERGRVYLHDTALDSWRLMQLDGRIREDVHGTLQIEGTELALYHHEQHMARVDYQIWVVYETVSPAHLGVYDGVPIVWVYRKPSAVTSRGPP